MSDLVDFSECEFISESMKFYTYQDFTKDCELIKRRFNTLSSNGKKFYMWYLYANTHMTLSTKNKIWNYLNGYCNKKDLFN